MRVLFSFFFLIIATAPAFGGEPIEARPCRTDPRAIGECFAVHGRLRFGNGNPMLRMWRVGTKRYLGILDDEEPIVPASLTKCLEPGFERNVFGDFMVCPFTPRRPGWMQAVCIESARNVIIQEFGLDESNKPVQPTRACGPRG